MCLVATAKGIYHQRDVTRLKKPFYKELSKSEEISKRF